MAKVEVYLEIGRTRAFAGALAWPGWCRSGADAESALRALLDYAPRYRASLGAAARGFKPPRDVSGFEVVERLKGNSSTDFGAPGQIPAYDAEPPGAAELKRLVALQQACWAAFDAAAKAASRKTLRTGPRGGGRDLQKMIGHVLEGDWGYLTQLGGRHRSSGASAAQEMKRVRRAFLDALAARAHGELPDRGPRGGVRWPARYAVRRSAWHVLDHAWEIEDRAEPKPRAPARWEGR